MPLALYGHPFSSYTQKALIALYENATPFRIASVALALLLAGSGCSAHPRAEAPETQTAPPIAADGATRLEGWIVFRREFHLYPKQADIGRLAADACISGTFASPAAYETASENFAGKKVVLTGFLMDPREYWGDGLQGYSVGNYCRGETIFIARHIQLSAP